MRDREQPWAHYDRRGLTFVEVSVVLGLAAVVFLFLLMAVPRGREQARLAACQKNLAQIGQALSLYDQIEGALPTVGPLKPLDAPPSEAGPGPLRTLLETLGQADFRGLAPGAPPPPRGPVPGEVPVPGFVCASDPNSTAGLFTAPVSYRAATGSDHHGRDGPFAPGRRISLARIEQADGTSYTAGFSERLVGDGRDGSTSAANYAVVPGRLPDGGCTAPLLEDLRAAWRGDAGSSWRTAGYVSTLYNHGLRPSGGSSCLAADGASAFLGASSGHPRGVNLLMLDGSVRLVLPSIAPRIWQAYATTEPPAARPAGP